MPANLAALDAIRPKLIERSCGGWLAHAPRGAALTIGVTAETEEEARRRFSATVAEWREMFAAARK